MFLPAFLCESPARRAEREKAHRVWLREQFKSRLEIWSSRTAWKDQLFLDGEKYNRWLADEWFYFGGRELHFMGQPVAKLLDRTASNHLVGYGYKLIALSKGQRFAYATKRLPRGEPLDTYSGARRGKVWFNAAVDIPVLLDLTWYETGRGVWMSLTPMEMLSLRPGTRKAKGRVVVAGLGLGYQLIEVSRRKNVTDLVLVEKDQEIVDFLWPEVGPRLHGGKSISIITGDARTVLPTLTADVGLVDIARGYGGNTFLFGVNPCPHIKEVWVWGAGQPADTGW